MLRSMRPADISRDREDDLLKAALRLVVALRVDRPHVRHAPLIDAVLSECVNVPVEVTAGSVALTLVPTGM